MPFSGPAPEMNCDDNEHLDEEALLEQVGEVRRLARFLVRDPNLAEDILQDTYLLALERPPSRARRGIELWAWLRRVVRTMARQHFRTERRRRVREQRASGPERAPSFVDELLVAERAATVRSILCELPEPYGSTLQLRLLEGMEPKDIARLQGIPPATVRMRLTRGLRKVQAELEARRERRSAGGLLAFLGLPRRRDMVPIFGGAAVFTGVAVVGAVLLSDARDLGSTSEPEALAVHAVDAGSPERVESFSRSSRRPVAVDHPVDETANAGDSTIRGIALWPDGRPAAGVTLELVGSERPEDLEPIRGVSAPDGSFSLRARFPDTGVAWVTSGESERAAILAGPVNQDSLLGLTVVVLADVTSLTGIVVDGAGSPVRDATVRWHPPADLKHRLGVSATFSKATEIRAETDDHGEFTLETVPVCEGSSLSVRAERFPPADVPVDAPWERIVVRLGDREPFRGRVVGPRGEPLEGATVCTGLERCSTLADGSFELTLAADATDVRIAKSGFAPLTLQAPGEDAPPFVELQLEGARPAIRGRVVDTVGLGIAGIRVQAVDLEAAHWDGKTLWSLEGLCSSPPRPVPEPAVTGSDGEFSLAGLHRRPYRVLAVDPRFLHATEATFQPGDGPRELVMSHAEHALDVAGRITDMKGVPVVGASVWVMRTTSKILDDGAELHAEYMLRDPVRSTPEGTFELKDVPLDAWIHAEATSFFPVRMEPAAIVELVPPRRCELILEDAPENVRYVRIADAEDRPLPVLGLENSTALPRVVDGRTSVLVVGEQAARMELLDGEERLLGALPLLLDPTAVNRVTGAGLVER